MALSICRIGRISSNVKMVTSSAVSRISAADCQNRYFCVSAVEVCSRDRPVSMCSPVDADSSNAASHIGAMASTASRTISGGTGACSEQCAVDSPQRLAQRLQLRAADAVGCRRFDVVQRDQQAARGCRDRPRAGPDRSAPGRAWRCARSRRSAGTVAACSAWSPRRCEPAPRSRRRECAPWWRQSRRRAAAGWKPARSRSASGCSGTSGGADACRRILAP